jgi:hypothetical protein
LGQTGQVGAGIHSRGFAAATCGEKRSGANRCGAHQTELFEEVFSIHREVPLGDDDQK